MDEIKIPNKTLNPRPHPSLIVLGIVTLIIGITIDCYLLPNETVTIAYIPVMLMIGFLARYYISNFILATLVTILLEYASPTGFVVEIFLLRCMGYFLISSFVQTLVRNNRKEQENLITLTLALASSLDARDNYTAFHSKNVAYFSYEVGKALKLKNKECTHLYIGGLLHDIGKIGIPESILNKPSRLTNIEYDIIKQHPQKGFDILKHVPSFRKNSILDMVLYHHERYDGNGYPKGLSGEEIPLVARIIGVSDAFDAMTSQRAYRNTNDLEFALNEISNGKGSQFDPKIADVFLGLVKEGAITIRGLNDE